jgi:hypothetical protein
MPAIRQEALDEQARRWLRPDWRRFFRPGSQNDPLYRYYERIERKYNPQQPRVPAGQREGGQWTSETDPSAEPRTREANVIWICVAGSSSRWTILDTGYKGYSVTYDCAGGISVTHTGPGHWFPALIRDPYRR